MILPSTHEGLLPSFESAQCFPCQHSLHTKNKRNQCSAGTRGTQHCISTVCLP